MGLSATVAIAKFTFGPRRQMSACARFCGCFAMTHGANDCLVSRWPGLVRCRQEAKPGPDQIPHDNRAQKHPLGGRIANNVQIEMFSMPGTPFSGVVRAVLTAVQALLRRTGGAEARWSVRLTKPRRATPGD